MWKATSGTGWHLPQLLFPLFMEAVTYAEMSFSWPNSSWSASVPLQDAYWQLGAKHRELHWGWQTLPPVLMNLVILLHLWNWHTVRNATCRSHEFSWRNPLRTNCPGQITSVSLLFPFKTESAAQSTLWKCPCPRRGAVEQLQRASTRDLWKALLQIFKCHYGTHTHMYILQKAILAIHIQVDYPD